MKKVCLLITSILALQSTRSACAQTAASPSPTVRARAASLTRVLAGKVSLEEGQYVKVKQLNEHMLAEVDAIKTQYAASQGTQDQYLAEIQARYDAELLNLMRPAQLALYQKARTSMTALSTIPE